MSVCELRMNRKIMYRKRQRARKRRKSVKGAFMFMLVLAAAILCINAVSTAFAKGTGDCISITVSAGDTLWSIAQKYNPDNRDIRSVIGDIQRANNMTGSDIRAGDTLAVPVNLVTDNAENCE